MIVLLIADYPQITIIVEIPEFKFRRAQILCDIYRSPVTAKYQFFIQAFLSKIYPYRVILFFEKNTIFQTFFDDIFPKQIGVGLIIGFVEIHANLVISLIKTSIYPLIHFLPKCNGVCIALLP